jgi:hypothetical protein
MRILYSVFAFLLLWVLGVMGCSRENLVPTVPPPPTPTLTPTVTHTPTPHKVIFVTSTAYTATDIGSLANADSLCTSQALAAGRGGTWRAWLSDATTNAIDRIVDVGPWYSVDQANLVFANRAAMAVGPSSTVQLDQYGNFIYDMPLLVWTGTLNAGTVSTTHCSSWTAGSGSTGTVGNASWAVASQWSYYVNYADCGAAYRMYCIEQ